MTSDRAAAGARPTDYARLRALLDGSAAVVRPLPECMSDIAAVARDILDCSHAAVVVRAPDGTVARFVPLDSPAEVPVAGGLLDGQLFDGVLYDGDTIRTRDIVVDPHSAPLHRTERPAHEVLGVPIRVAGQVTGGLFVTAHSDDRRFDGTDEHAARVVASAAGFLIERDRVSNEVEARQRWLIESTMLTRELVSGAHERPFELLVRRAVEMADGDLAAVVLPSPDGRSLTVAAAAGSRADEILHRSFVRAGTIADEVILAGEPRTVENLLSSTARPLIADALGVDALLLVPFTVGAGGDGVFAVMRDPGREPFSELDVALVATFAAQMAMAIELNEARAVRERKALFGERDRIARDLHDHVIQRLFAIGLTMQGIVGHTEPDTAERLTASIDDLDHTILQIRSTIYRLTGPVLSDVAALRPQVSELVNELEAVLGFGVDLDIQGPVDFGVDEALAHDVVAVLRETLTNVARHSGATATQVSIGLAGSVFTLVVADNGHGLGETTRRSGLANLRSRAVERGGTMQVESGLSGTRITWSVPTDV